MHKVNLVYNRSELRSHQVISIPWITLWLVHLEYSQVDFQYVEHLVILKPSNHLLEAIQTSLYANQILIIKKMDAKSLIMF